MRCGLIHPPASAQSSSHRIAEGASAGMHGAAGLSLLGSFLRGLLRLQEQESRQDGVRAPTFPKYALIMD